MPVAGFGADVLANRVANLAGPMLEHGFVAAFDQEAGFRFGAGVTQQNPPAVRLHFRFGLRHELHHAIEFFKGTFFPHAHVGDELREARP